MLGCGWQWVEKTENRARAQEYSTEEKQGVWGSDGGQARQSSTNVTGGAMQEGQGLCKEECTGNEFQWLSSQVQKLETESWQAKGTCCQDQVKGHSVEMVSNSGTFVCISFHFNESHL